MANNRYDESDHLFPYLEIYQTEFSSGKTWKRAWRKSNLMRKQTMRQGKGDVMGMLADLISDNKT